MIKFPINTKKCGKLVFEQCDVHLRNVVVSVGKGKSSRSFHKIPLKRYLYDLSPQILYFLCLSISATRFVMACQIYENQSVIHYFLC